MVLYERVKVRLKLIKGFGKKLTWFYSYGLYSALLDVIGMHGSYVARHIHGGSYKRSFVFSWLIPSSKDREKLKSADKEGFEPFYNAHFYITSRDREIKAAIVRYLNNSLIWLGSRDIVYKVVGVVRELYDVSSKESFSFLSPFVLRDKEGVYINQFDKSSIKKSLRHYFHRLSKSIGIEVELDLIDVVGEFRKKLFYVHNTPVVAVVPSSKDSKLILRDNNAKALALYMGIGDKTHLGFGMVGI